MGEIDDALAARVAGKERLAGRDPVHWDVEDDSFWRHTGKRIAFRNLLISIPCLLMGFAVWMMWSVLIVQMERLGYAFSKDQLYTLPAIGGLAGATLRIPNSFIVGICGGRNVKVVTTALLLIPVVGTGIALSDRGTSFTVFAVLAAMTGVGGGAFASSMSNISGFFPKRMQGLALGLNAGIGNIGVSIMQVVAPLAMTVALFGALAGDPQPLPDGGSLWIQNGALVWTPVLVVLLIAAALFMNNLPMHRCGPAPVAMGKMLWLELMGFAGAGVGVALLLFADLGLPELSKILLVLVVTIVATLALMRYGSPAPVREALSRQFVIFRHKHNWVMTWLYTMTFGSFIGYSAAFPKLIQDVFGKLPDGSINPAAPDPLAYAWLGPLVGSLARPVGGWIADKLGGARVTQWTTLLMIACAILLAVTVKAAGASETPESHWVPFFLLFMALFIGTGIGNGSTFRMVPFIFDRELAGPVLGWTSAVAAYGSFLIPKIFGGQIQAGTPELALYGFAGYYVSCLAVNWWFYARRNAEIPC